MKVENDSSNVEGCSEKRMHVVGGRERGGGKDKKRSEVVEENEKVPKVSRNRGLSLRGLDVRKG